MATSDNGTVSLETPLNDTSFSIRNPAAPIPTMILMVIASAVVILRLYIRVGKTSMAGKSDLCMTVGLVSHEAPLIDIQNAHLH
jgi:hypothetical protein